MYIYIFTLNKKNEMHSKLVSFPLSTCTRPIRNAFHIRNLVRGGGTYRHTLYNLYKILVHSRHLTSNIVPTFEKPSGYVPVLVTVTRLHSVKPGP